MNRWALLMGFAWLAGANASFVTAQDKADAKSATAPSADVRFEAKEHYRFNLGGPSGEYTDWERSDLDGFEGLATTVTIDKTYGKPGDKWAAIGKIRLLGAGDEKTRRVLALTLYADRKTLHVTPLISLGSGKEDERFDVQYEVGKPINLTILPMSAGKLVFSFDGHGYEVPCDFEIKGIAVVGSGVDIKFDPFNLMRRVIR